MRILYRKLLLFEKIIQFKMSVPTIYSCKNIIQYLLDFYYHFIVLFLNRIPFVRVIHVILVFVIQIMKKMSAFVNVLQEILENFVK